MPFQGATRDNNIRAGTGVDKLGRSQALASVDRAKMNVRGGSIAIGNSFAAIGAQLASALAKLLAQWDSGGG